VNRTTRARAPANPRIVADMTWLKPGVLALTTVCLSACGGGGDTPTTESTGADTTVATTGDATTHSPPTTNPDPDTSLAGTDTDSGMSDPGTDPAVTSTDPVTTDPVTTDPVTTDPATTDTSTSTSDTDTSTSGTTGPSCGICNQPNEQCIDDMCVMTCQGQDPDPCGPELACDVISGECKDPELDACVLAGPSTACGASTCGPGTVCDGVDTCLAIAPCAGVVCTDEGACWGDQCICERAIACSDPAIDLLNGPFSTEIGGIDFADDCHAWMVTLRSGPDYLRRLKPDGTLDQWTGVANLNMGEVKILRELTVPQLTAPFPLSDEPVPPSKIEGIGEVAITYTCCATCGCQANPPQGVARLVEEDMMTPLPIVIVAIVTQGTGPFTGNAATAANAGPQGLTWGADRVLYVGNSTANGIFNSADLEAMTQTDEAVFMARVTASAPVSPAHLVVGLDGGEVYRFNVLTKQSEFVISLEADITSFSHDKFTGEVYAGLSTLEIVRFHPFTGEVTSFDTMPAQGRVAVSPSGTLYYTPVRYLVGPAPKITAYDLPDAF